MADAAASRSHGTPSLTQRAGLRLASRAQRRLLGAAVLAMLGSALPWVSTPLGNIGGLRGAGLWTLYAGVAGVAGALVPWRRVALAHAAVLAAAALVLPGWQFLRIVALSLETGTVGTVVPGMGLVATLAGGALAAGAAVRLRTG